MNGMNLAQMQNFLPTRRIELMVGVIYATIRVKFHGIDFNPIPSVISKRCWLSNYASVRMRTTIENESTTTPVTVTSLEAAKKLLLFHRSRYMKQLAK